MIQLPTFHTEDLNSHSIVNAKLNDRSSRSTSSSAEANEIAAVVGKWLLIPSIPTTWSQTVLDSTHAQLLSWIRSNPNATKYHRWGTDNPGSSVTICNNYGDRAIRKVLLEYVDNRRIMSSISAVLSAATPNRPNTGAKTVPCQI